VAHAFVGLAVVPFALALAAYFMSHPPLRVSKRGAVIAASLGMLGIAAVVEAIVSLLTDAPEQLGLAAWVGAFAPFVWIGLLRFVPQIFYEGGDEFYSSSHEVRAEARRRALRNRVIRR
jgi:hypothetical protein